MTHEQINKAVELMPSDELIKISISHVQNLVKSRGMSFKKNNPPMIYDTDIIFYELINRYINITTSQLLLNCELCNQRKYKTTPTVSL